MVVLKENATSDVMASGSVRTALESEPEPTVRLSEFALNIRIKTSPEHENNSLV